MQRFYFYETSFMGSFATPTPLPNTHTKLNAENCYQNCKLKTSHLFTLQQTCKISVHLGRIYIFLQSENNAILWVTIRVTFHGVSKPYLAASPGVVLSVWTLTNPAACSYDFSPSPFTHISCSRHIKGPVVSRNSTTFFAFAEERPATRLEKSIKCLQSIDMTVLN